MWPASRYRKRIELPRATTVSYATGASSARLRSASATVYSGTSSRSPPPAPRSRRRAADKPGPFGFHFLDVRAVGKHDGEEIDGRGSRVDRAVEAARGEPRQQARVVDVRVCQEREIELSDVEVERGGVTLARVATALEHAAVDEQRRPGGVDAKARSGDLAGRAEKRDFRHPAGNSSSFAAGTATHFVDLRHLTEAAWGATVTHLHDAGK